MADAQHSSASVMSLVQNAPTAKDLLHADANLLNSFDDQFVTLCDAGKLAEKLRDEAKVKELREQVKALVQAQETLKQHSQALHALKQTYTCTGEVTDFKARLQPRDGAGASAAAELEKQLQTFDRAVWNVHHAGQPMPGESDDGLWVDTQDAVATNTRCPLTGKNVLELTEPVKDNKGYVYEKEAILSYIRKKGGGSVISPNAGVSQYISASELVPAKQVIRQAKRKQLASQQGGASGAHDDHELID